MKPDLLLSDKLYIPDKYVDKKLAAKYYDIRVFVQKMCDICPIYRNNERFSDTCSTCDGYKGRYKTYDTVEIKRQQYYSFPSGNINKVLQNLGLNKSDFNLIDKRCDKKVKHPLTFTANLYTGKEIINGSNTTDQVSIVKQFAKHKRGLIVSPARSGKSAIAAFIYCKSKRRTLFLAHEKQLLEQFYRTVLKFTNLKEMREQTGKKIAGIIEKESDWKEDWDLVICNYQKFLSEKGFSRVKKYIIGDFSQVIIDEAHHLSAAGYTNFFSKIDAKRKIGMSATITRKDNTHFILHQLLGDVAAVGTTTAKTPSVKVIRTKITTDKVWKGKAGYVFTNQWLATNKDRNKLLVKQIFKDLRENPLNSIVIPVLFVNHAIKLASMINSQAIYNNENRNENWSLDLAQAYYGNKSFDRTKILDDVRSGDIRVLIPIRKMVKEGIDVPRWNIIYLQTPMNNYEECYQMTQRVNTPYEGKPTSIIKIFVDDIGLSIGCFKATYGHLMRLKYNIDEENKEIADSLMHNKPRASVYTKEGW